jgi:hypothetical protein
LANFHSHPCIFPSRHSLFSFSLPRTHSLLSSSQPRRQQQPARRSSMATNLPCGELLPPSSHAAERPPCRPPPGARPCKPFPPTGRAGALSSSPMATSSPSTHSPRRSTPARSSTPTFFLPVSLAAGAGALLSPIRRPAQRPPSRALPYPWPVNAQANALCSSMAAGRRRHLLPMALDTPMKLPWALEMPSSRRSPGRTSVSMAVAAPSRPCVGSICAATWISLCRVLGMLDEMSQRAAVMSVADLFSNAKN